MEPGCNSSCCWGLYGRSGSGSDLFAHHKHHNIGAPIMVYDIDCYWPRRTTLATLVDDIDCYQPQHCQVVATQSKHLLWRHLSTPLLLCFPIFSVTCYKQQTEPHSFLRASFIRLFISSLSTSPSTSPLWTVRCVKSTKNCCTPNVSPQDLAPTITSYCTE